MEPGSSGLLSSTSQWLGFWILPFPPLPSPPNLTNPWAEEGAGKGCCRPVFQGFSGEAQNLAETMDHPGASPPIPPFLEDLGKHT